ncbi:MAG: hypothetical protein ABH839_00735, partial [Chloroflexota bacterium]
MGEVDLIIQNGKVVSPEETIEADIAVKDGKIVAIAQVGLMPPA